MSLGAPCLQETSEGGKPLFPRVRDAGALSEVRCTMLVPRLNAMVTHVPYDIISMESLKPWSLLPSNKPSNESCLIHQPRESLSHYGVLPGIHIFSQHSSMVQGGRGRLEVVEGSGLPLALLWTARGIWLGCATPQPASVQNKLAVGGFSPN